MSEQETVQEELKEELKEEQKEESKEEPKEEVSGGRKKKAKKEKAKKSLGREILEWVLTILVAVVAALIIRSFVFELVRVDGGSMDNTLNDGEIMFVSKFDYSSTWLSLPFAGNNAVESAPRITFGDPKRLDVVICRYPGRGGVNFVKRVVGKPGEYVELRNGYLYINGTKVEEESKIKGISDDYRKGGIAYTFGPYYVPQKGDTVKLTGVDKTLQLLDYNYVLSDDISLEINGAAWTRGRTCLVINADGKTLKIYHRNTDDGSRETDSSKISMEPVVSYDGKIYTPSEFYSAHSELFNRELTVNEDYYFVMGDHRNNSNDSRSVGALERSAIIGHARSVVFPFANWRGVE